MKKQPLRVGFDLDGVILYNPIRIVRPIISFVKRAFLHKQKLSFYYPHSPIEKWLWRQFHRTSIFIAPGIDDIIRMVKEKKIRAYIVTARFAFLGPEFIRWIKTNHFDQIFEDVYFNECDEQPHFFKERMINKLKLDFFIEDNFDIVKYASQKTGTKILWVYNIFDMNIPYKYKFPNLAKAINSIKNETSK